MRGAPPSRAVTQRKRPTIPNKCLGVVALPLQFARRGELGDRAAIVARQHDLDDGLLLSGGLLRACGAPGAVRARLQDLDEVLPEFLGVPGVILTEAPL